MPDSGDNLHLEMLGTGPAPRWNYDRILLGHGSGGGLTADLIRYEQLQRWDGKLPVFSGGNATPLIDATSIISDTAGQ